MLCSSNSIFSQTVIKGNVVFENNKNETSCLVSLKEDEETIAYTFTEVNNTFILETNKIGTFKLSFSSMNFETKLIVIEVSAKTKLIEKNIFLNYKPVILEEVIIESDKQIKIKNDTIIYNAKSFLEGNEQVVEDLLKKIPGITISSNGTVKVGNQEVEKIMIEGDDIFEKGYKILTKNMPVNPIDKVELYQNYSNNRHLKGIENSDKVALNLTLKESYKRQWFGNALLGYGAISENRYDLRSNLMNFGKKSKYYFIANLNNLGDDVVGDINHLIRPYRIDEPSSIGDNQSAKTLLSLTTDLPNLKQKRINFNNAELFTLNTIFSLTNKVKLKTLGFVNTDENDSFSNSFQSFSFNNTTFTNNEKFLGRKRQITCFGKVDLTYDISKYKTFEYTGKFNKTNETNNSDLLFNDILLKEKLSSNNQLFDQKLVYTNKFNDYKVIIISGRYINEKTPQNYSVNQFIFNDLFSENANNTRQYSQNHMQFSGIEAHLFDKKNNGDLLEIKTGNQLRIDKLKTDFELLDFENILSYPDNYQNNLEYFTNDLYISAKYRFKFGEYNLLAQSDFHQLWNKLENFGVTHNQKPLLIIPKLGLDWQLNEQNKIITSFSYNTTNAGILDVYSGFVQTGFRSFSKGLGEFNILNSSNAILNYTNGNWGDKFFANMFIAYSKNHDFYSTNSMISQNYFQSEKIIIKDRNFITISSNIDYYFKLIKSNLKINLSASKTNFKNIVNDFDLREVKNINAEYGLELRSGFRGIFNYHIGSKWNYNEVITTITNSYTDNMNFLDLSFVMNDKFNFQIQTERYFFGNLDKQNNEYYFMDLEARYTIKENKLTFSLSGNNLFNTATYKNYSITDISVSKTEYRLQPRYLLLKMEFRF